MIVSMFLSLPYCALKILATGKRVNNEGKYSLEIPANFHFYGPKKVIKLAEKYNYKDRRKIKRNCKTLSKVKCIQIWSVCREVSAIKCPLHRDFVTRG